VNIQIDGTNTRNKGAELMLYAILNQVEKQQPAAEVFFNTYFGDVKDVHTSIQFKKRAVLFSQYPDVILKKLGIKSTYFSIFHPNREIDVLFDASGFRFGDQWNHSDYYIERMNNYYSELKRSGCKIIFLPQALGPFEKKNAKESAKIISRFADRIYAREVISKQYLMNAGADIDKVFVTTDFSNLVDGEYKGKLNLENSICLIPNYKMVVKTSLSEEELISFYINVINHIQSKEKSIILLNHEGEQDRVLCSKIKEKMESKVDIVDNLNAKEIKGVIGNCYAVISSRYHGVASSLSQSVPCLATSWSHKYEMLFKDYDSSDCIIDVNDKTESVLSKVDHIIDEKNNAKTREGLRRSASKLKNQVENMWEDIWELIQR